MNHDDESLDPLQKVLHDAIVSGSSRVGDVGDLRTPIGLLRLMVWEIWVNLDLAQTAIDSLLELQGEGIEHDQDIWRQVQILVTAVTAACSYIWPAKAQFADRGSDLVKLLRVGEGELAQLRRVRNGLAHMDERLEMAYRDGLPGLTTRGVWAAGEPQPGHLLGWDEDSKILYSLDVVVDAVKLKDEIAVLNKRASDGTFWAQWAQ